MECLGNREPYVSCASVVHCIAYAICTRLSSAFSITCNFKNRSIHVRKMHSLVFATEIECALLKYPRCSTFFLIRI